MAQANRMGRKPGRGWRPYLLVPKVIAVAVLMGGLAGSAVLLHGAAPGSADGQRALLGHVSRLVHWLIIPGGTAAVVLGAGLVLQAPRVLLGRRWLQLKLVLAVVAMGGGHVAARLAIERARATLDAGGDAATDLALLAWVCTVTAALLALIIAVGRHKPRLRQPIKRRFPNTQAADVASRS